MENFLDIIKDLKTEEDFGYILQNFDNSGEIPPNYLKFQKILEKINSDSFTKSKNEKWDSSCEKTDGCQDDISCYNPLSCLPSQRSWISSSSDILKYYALIINDIKNSIEFAKNENSENGGYKTKLEELKDSYNSYLEGYIDVLGKLNITVNQINDIFKEYNNDEGGLFSFMNCKFIGINLRIMLNYIKSYLGNQIYIIGICLLIVGCSLAISISSSILLIIIIDLFKNENKNIDKLPEYRIKSGDRIILFQ